MVPPPLVCQMMLQTTTTARLPNSNQMNQNLRPGFAAACSPKRENIVLLIGADSIEFEEAREGTEDSFGVGGPLPEEPYGEVTIYADDQKIDTFTWGGSMRTLNEKGNPPSKISFVGEIQQKIYYGISQLDDEYRGILLKKGMIETGGVTLTLHWNPNTQTYETNRDRTAHY